LRLEGASGPKPTKCPHNELATVIEVIGCELMVHDVGKECHTIDWQSIFVVPYQNDAANRIGDSMKLDFYQTMIYRGSDHGDSWPSPPRACDPVWAQATYDHSLDECGAALDAGFDSLNFAEHHYSPKQLTPDPVVYAAMVTKRYPSANIGVFGTDLPLNNPVRVAEQYAMLDNLTGGKLRFGLLRGTPNEYLTYGSNPWESRERFEEACALIVRCFTEPDPFGWEGRYYRFRNIAVWPRCAQDPHPRILVSGNSPDSAAFAGRMGFDIGFSYMPPAAAAAHLEIYKTAAREHGWEPTSDNVSYRQFMYVADSDAQAEEHRPSFYMNIKDLFAAASPHVMAALGTAGAAMNGAPRNFKPDPSKPGGPPPFWPPLYGSPDTVLKICKEIKDTLNPGRLEVSVGGGFPLPHEWSMRTIKLIGEEIVPVLSSASF
jgi:alkanesulfonate monooxygenase SsuD/methylene tetrahydromethanopterin reductase-like flavin-dependent oxidoreductase (luciferase family)